MHSARICFGNKCIPVNDVEKMVSEAFTVNELTESTGLDLYVLPDDVALSAAKAYINTHPPTVRGVEAAFDLHALMGQTRHAFRTCVWKGVFRSRMPGTYTFSAYTTHTLYLYVNTFSPVDGTSALIHAPEGAGSVVGSIVLEEDTDYPFYMVLQHAGPGAQLGLSCITPAGQIVSDFTGFWYAK